LRRLRATDCPSALMILTATLHAIGMPCNVVVSHR
jgi:hypothetical protein